MPIITLSRLGYSKHQSQTKSSTAASQSEWVERRIDMRTESTLENEEDRHVSSSTSTAGMEAISCTKLRALEKTDQAVQNFKSSENQLMETEPIQNGTAKSKWDDDDSMSMNSPQLIEKEPTASES